MLIPFAETMQLTSLEASPPWGRGMQTDSTKFKGDKALETV